MKKNQLVKQEAYQVFLYLTPFIWLSLIFLSFPSFADDSVCILKEGTKDQIEGVICFPYYERKECLIEMLRSKWKGFKENLKNIWHKVGCSVNTASREFADQAVDISVKVPGGKYFR